MQQPEPGLAAVFIHHADQAKITQEINAALPLRRALLIDELPVIVLETGDDQAAAERVAMFLTKPGPYSTEWLWDHWLGYIVLDVSSGDPETTQFAIRFEWPRDQTLLTAMLVTSWVGLAGDIGDVQNITVRQLTFNLHDLTGIVWASRSVHQ